MERLGQSGCGCLRMAAIIDVYGDARILTLDGWIAFTATPSSLLATVHALRGLIPKANDCARNYLTSPSLP